MKVRIQQQAINQRSNNSNSCSTEELNRIESSATMMIRITPQRRSRKRSQTLSQDVKAVVKSNSTQGTNLHPITSSNNMNQHHRRSAKRLSRKSQQLFLWFLRFRSHLHQHRTNRTFAAINPMFLRQSNNYLKIIRIKLRIQRNSD